MKYKKQEGITLTILVITIIVMLILAGASLSLIFDKEGVLKSAQTTKEAQENYANKAEEKSNTLIDSVDEEINGTYKDPSGANAPKLKNGMIPVKWNEDDKCWVVTDSNDKQWYSYNDKKWANIMLTDGLVVDGISNASTAKLLEMKNKKVTSVGSMFVWIPRYAYQITNNYHNGGANINGTINVEFLKDKTNTPVKSSVKIVEYNEETTENYTKFPDGYVVHPAFEYGEQVSGIWVAKFEASLIGATTVKSENQYNKTDKTLQVKPSVCSWRSISIGNAYTVCLNYRPYLNSHMIKNTEWGALSYLSYGKYGRDGEEISQNQCNTMITGAGPGLGSNPKRNSSYEYDNSNFESQYGYTSEQGKLSSTTKNETGVYDVSGGATEFVSTYLENNYSKDTTNDSYKKGSTIINGASKTRDMYVGSQENTNILNYETNKNKYGDVLWETSKDGGGISGYGSWYAQRSLYFENMQLYLSRGGSATDGNFIGPFYFRQSNGNGVNEVSFRPVLIVL